MNSDLGDETLRYLVDKYITKGAPNEAEEDSDSEDEAGAVLRKAEQVMQGVTQFINGYMDEANRARVH